MFAINQKKEGIFGADNGWVFAKLPLQILKIKHKCWWAILQIPC